MSISRAKGLINKVLIKLTFILCLFILCLYGMFKNKYVLQWLQICGLRELNPYLIFYMKSSLKLCDDLRNTSLA